MFKRYSLEGCIADPCIVSYPREMESVAGEVRTDCGGCHAHSQEPTDFNLTAAAKPDYAVWDLTKKTPLVTTMAADDSKKTWDA